MIPLHTLGPLWATRAAAPSLFVYYDSFTDAQWGETGSIISHRRTEITLDRTIGNTVALPGEVVTTVELKPLTDAARVALAGGSPPQTGQIWRWDISAFDQPSVLLPMGQRGLTGQIKFPVQCRHITNPTSFSGYLYGVGFIGLVDNGATVELTDTGPVTVNEYSQGTLAFDPGQREGTILSFEVNCDGSTIEMYVWARGWAYDNTQSPIDARPAFTDYSSVEIPLTQTLGLAELFSVDFTDGFDTVTFNAITTLNTATGEFKAYLRPTNGQPDVEIWPALGSPGDIAGIQAIITDYFEVGLKQRGYVRSYESPASNDYTSASVPYIKLLPT